MSLFADLTELQPSEVADNDFLLIYARSLQKARKVKAKAFRQGEVESVNGKKGAVQLKMPDVVNVGDNLSYNEQTNTLSADAQEITVDSELSGTSTNPVQNKAVKAALENKVDKIAGKGLSTNDYTTAEKNKLASLEKITVDPDISSDSYHPVQSRAIKEALDKKVDKTDSRLTDARPASDVYAWAKASSKPAYTAAEVGAIATTEKGTANGVASLDDNGKVPSSQLPSYVDDVLEYASLSAFPSTGESGKIYIAQDTNKTYRWSGTAYAEISESLALGETSSTAFAGNRGKAIEDKIPSNASSSNKLVVQSALDTKISRNGDTINNAITRESGGLWIRGRDNCTVKQTKTNPENHSWNPVVGVKTQNGHWSMGSVGGESFMLSYDTDADYNAGNNNSAVVNFPPAGSSGTLALTSQIPTDTSQLTNRAGFISDENIQSILDNYTFGHKSPVRVQCNTAGWDVINGVFVVQNSESLDSTEYYPPNSNGFTPTFDTATPPPLNLTFFYDDGNYETKDVTPRLMEYSDAIALLRYLPPFSSSLEYWLNTKALNSKWYSTFYNSGYRYYINETYPQYQKKIRWCYIPQLSDIKFIYGDIITDNSYPLSTCYNNGSFLVLAKLEEKNYYVDRIYTGSVSYGLTDKSYYQQSNYKLRMPTVSDINAISKDVLNRICQNTEFWVHTEDISTEFNYYDPLSRTIKTVPRSSYPQKYYLYIDILDASQEG